MKAVKDHVFAAQTSLQLLSKGKIWLYILPSVTIAVLFYIVSYYFSGIGESTKIAESIPFIGKYVTIGLQKTVSFFGWIGNQIYIFSILTLLSPISCLLSEKVDNEVTGAKFDGGIVRMLTDLYRAFLILLFTVLLNFLVVGCWTIISWITGFHLLDPIIYFLVGSFFIGFSFYDFSLERYSVGFFGTIGYGFENMAYMALTGIAFNLIYMIPVVGLLLAPFLVTILSTIVFVKMNNKIPNKQISNAY